MSTQKTMTDPYGMWRVTTEGDCEGRSVRDLGVYEGFFDEVALRLADKSYYSLTLTPVEPVIASKMPELGLSVVARLNVDQRQAPTADSTRRFFSEFLASRPVNITKASSWLEVTIEPRLSAKERERVKKNKLRADALAKLSVEEKRALGLED